MVGSETNRRGSAHPLPPEIRKESSAGTALGDQFRGVSVTTSIRAEPGTN